MATSTPQPLGLRERKNRRTRLAIVKATAELTIEESYAAATIARIAERADVAPRTVSTWFPSKDEILFEGSDAIIERGVGHIHGGQGDVADRLLAWFTDEADRSELDPEIARLRNDAIQHDPELRARYRQIFDRLHGELAKAAANDLGLPVTRLAPQLFAGAALAFIEQLAALSASGVDFEQGAAELETGLEFLRAGLAAITPQR